MSENLKSWLQRRLAAVLQTEAEAIDPDLAFHELGLESIELIEISGDLERKLGKRLDPDLLYGYPTINLLSNHLEAVADQDSAIGGAVVSEPIAIVGIGCRFPGADGPEDFWKLLLDGRDAISEVPEDRWSIQQYYHEGEIIRGKSASKWGGFMADIDGFDHSFFGISRAEAIAMDPQQRILLETCYEAFEDAGQPIRALKGRQVGVFVGICHNDFENLSQTDSSAIDQFTGTGNALSIAANRISYQFDFQGPSLAIDTACSSSLNAVHLAVRSLHSGECTVAVAGGVHVLLSPLPNIAFSQAGMMARDGRCKTFDNRADGYVRSEGVGLVVLKPMSRAIADGDRIYAVIRGSATNQDGRSNGLSAPNPQAQEAVLRAAYSAAGINPEAVTYVEAHGTGTKLGDPIEVGALARVVGAGSGRQDSCLIGSVKSNIGHLEAAAGVAGLIKAALAAYHGLVPPTLHVRSPNEHIPFAENGLSIAQTTVALESGCILGVSSFGFGGSNCHIVLGRQPTINDITREISGETLFLLSAPDVAGLDRVKERWRDFAARSSASEFHSLARVAALDRSHYGVRFAAVVEASQHLAAEIDLIGSDDGTAHGKKVAVVFPGQGSQYPSMAFSLSERFDLVDQRLKEADKTVRELAGFSILSEIQSGKNLDSTAIAQPAITAVQIAIYDLLHAIGLKPAAVIGHSVGEIAAAYAAGAIDFEEALKIAVARGAEMDAPDAAGKMLAVAAPLSQIEQILAETAIEVDIAAINAENVIVLSGPAAAIDQLSAPLRAAHLSSRLLNVRYAFHSRVVAAAAARVEQALGERAPLSPTLPFFSTVTGALFESPLDARYWASNVRQPVRFRDAVACARDDGIDTFVEVGPDSVLASLLRRLDDDRPPAHVIIALDRKAGSRTFLNAVGELYRLGFDIDATPIFPNPRISPTGPSYPWLHTSDLRDARLRSQAARERGLSVVTIEGLGKRMPVPADFPMAMWEDSISLDKSPWLADHKVGGSVVFPAAALLATLDFAASMAGANDGFAIQNCTIHRPLIINDEVRSIVKVDLGKGTESGEISMYVSSAGGTWDVYATANLIEKFVPELDVPSGARARCLESVATDYLYTKLQSVGLNYGPNFQRVQDLWRTDLEALASLAGSRSNAPFRIDPMLLDGALQLIAAAMPQFWAVSSTWLPSEIGAAWFSGNDPTGAYVRLKSFAADAAIVTADVILTGLAGEVVATISDLQLRRLSRENSAALRQEHLLTNYHFYQDLWVDRPDASPSPERPPKVLTLIDTCGRGEAIAAALEANGSQVVRLSRDDLQFAKLGEFNSGIDVSIGPINQFDAVVSSWPIDVAKKQPCDTIGELTSTLELVQFLTQAGGSKPPRLWLATETATKVGETDIVHPSQSAIWALGLAIGMESPTLRCTRVDLGGGHDSEQEAAPIARLIAEDPKDGDQFAVRAGAVYIRRVQEMTPQFSRPAIKSTGAYVITGGLGALGIEVARMLVREGAHRIHLIGRRSADANVLSLLASIGDDQANVTYSEVDVADGTLLAADLETLRREHPIVGVFHAAGAIDDRHLLNHDRQSFEIAWRGKAEGAWNVHLQTESDELDHFVMFSSATASLGSFGQANYMAANGFLNGLAELRASHGKTTCALEWGPWDEAGMAADAVASGSGAVARAGVSMIGPSDGTDILLGLMDGSAARFVVLPYDVADLLHLYPDTIGLKLFENLIGPDLERRRSHRSDARMLSRPALAEPYKEPSSELELLIVGYWQRALKVDPIGVNDPFFELGGDSVLAGQILSEVNRTLGVTIDEEAAFAALTVAKLAELAEVALADLVSGMSEDELDAALAGRAGA